MTPAEKMLLWEAESCLGEALKLLAKARRKAEAISTEGIEESGAPNLGLFLAQTIVAVGDARDLLRGGLQASTTPAVVVRRPDGEAA